MKHIRIIALLLICLLPLAACGSRTPSQGVVDQPTTIAKELPDPVTTTTTEPRPAGGNVDLDHPNVDMMVVNQLHDSLQVQEFFHEPQSFDDTDADKSELESCTNADNRSMVVRVEVQATVQSDQATRVQLSFGGGADSIVVHTNKGDTCPANGEYSGMGADQLEPHQTISGYFWVVIPDAITSSYPDGDPVIMGQAHIGRPTALLQSKPAETGQINGDHLLLCGSELRIFAAGTPQLQYGPSYSQTSCQKVSDMPNSYVFSRP